jgi:hypothetical protein
MPNGFWVLVRQLTLAHSIMEKIIFSDAAENKINIDKVRDSKVIQAQLELIRREQEA